ncbi:MAG: imidazoleglycerol-phosphate dehydratase HisB [Dehalococcoidia bacterium]|nr:imidazoleglycerol-phosphate dehydratase HisB [Dehalococcoidia bacterium]
MANRRATLRRETGETKIVVSLTLDGTGVYEVNTGNGMLDHLLAQLARHSLMDITIHADRDASGWHHVTEDVGIMLGRALREALGDGEGIRRMGHAIVPLDEALAMVAVDLSGRGHATLDIPWIGEQVEALPVEVISHLLESFAVEARINLHARVLAGQNNHHIAEAVFKALAKSLRDAVEVDSRQRGVPSTKGTVSS